MMIPGHTVAYSIKNVFINILYKMKCLNFTRGNLKNSSSKLDLSVNFYFKHTIKIDKK